MWKYLLAFAFFLAMAVYVARQDEYSAHKGAQNAEYLGNSAVAAKTDADHPQENIKNAERNTPSWYGFFRWPSGTTTWAIILTLLAIAEQTRHTAKAAKAAEDAVGKADETLISTKDTAKRQLRAYLTVKNAMLFLHDDGMLEPKVEIINSGQTPAFDFSGAYRGALGKYPLGDIGQPPSEVRKSNGAIGAGSTSWILGQLVRSSMSTANAVVLHLRAPDEVFFIKGYYGLARVG